MNFFIHLYDKIPYFDDRQNELLVNLISPNLYKTSRFVQGSIVKMIRYVNENTLKYEKTTILKCIEVLSLYNEIPNIIILNNGEDLDIPISPDPGKSFAGYNIRVYNAENGLALGEARVGNSDAIQYARISDLTLESYHTYRVHVVLEQDDDPSSILLREIFLIVEDTIDYETSLPPSSKEGAAFLDINDALFVDSNENSFLGNL